MVNKNTFIRCGDDRRDPDKRDFMIFVETTHEVGSTVLHDEKTRQQVANGSARLAAAPISRRTDNCRPTGHNNSTNIFLRCTHNTGQGWRRGGRSYVPCATGPAQMSKTFALTVPTCSSKSSLHTQMTLAGYVQGDRQT
jgi:hypothetical protein